MSFKIIWTTSVTRPCFTTQHQTCKTKTTACKTKTDFFWVSDRSCPKTDGLRLHHCFSVLVQRFNAVLLHDCLPVIDCTN